MGNYGEYFQILRAEASNRFSGLEIGFHFILFILSNIVNLVSIYQFLPALWACLGGLAIFYIAHKKTGRCFLGILAMIFFASIKSNVNITGLWFFTPLSFSIPLILLYLYFFSEGLNKENKKHLLLSLVIIAALIPTHSISVLFALPIFAICGAIYYQYIIREWKFFSIFLIIPIIGVLFYKYTLGLDWNELLASRFYYFQYGWGIVEIKNSLTETYSLIGYLLAIIGVIFILIKRQTKKFLLWLIWPLTVIILMIIYRLTGISLLSPYQRNIYYLTLSLPILSAIGLFYLIKQINEWIGQLIENHHTSHIQKFITVSIKLKIDPKYTKIVQLATGTLIVVLVFFATFFSYYRLPANVGLYRVINAEEYYILKYLGQFSPATVMAPQFISAAMFPISGHRPVGTYVFYGDSADVTAFFLSNDCRQKKEIIDRYQVKYIISPLPEICDYELIKETPSRFIYKTKQ